MPAARGDGLPFRVHERWGVRTYSIGYKFTKGKWAFRFSCPVTDTKEALALRRKAIEQSLKLEYDLPTGGFSALIDKWFSMQEALPANDLLKRAASTLRENRNEAKKLKAVLGHIDPVDLKPIHAYDYLDACKEADRPEKGNKEIALAKVILKWAIRKQLIETNPFDDIEKNKTKKVKHLIRPEEMALAVEVGRGMVSAQHIVALALKTAWLCVKRPVEARALTREGITAEGLIWTDGKDSSKPKVLIEWSEALRETIQEVQAIQRHKSATGRYVFGNLMGERYTKEGWGYTLKILMDACEAEAQKRGLPFRRFSLQDCRPLGVTDKLERGDTDTMNATGHTSAKMIAATYDRRPVRRASAAG